MKKKAQAAMEFLMTYGWAILVVLIAITALTYFGVLSPDLILPNKCIIDATSGLFCEDYTADSLNDITLRLKNPTEKGISIFSISVTTGIDEVGKGICMNSDSVLIEGKGYSDIIIGDSCDLDAEDKIKGEINILYGSEGFNKTTLGSIAIKVSRAEGDEEEEEEEYEGGAEEGVCQNAEDGGMCDGLDLVFGEGYQSQCCENYELCC